MSLRCFVATLREFADHPGRTVALGESESRHARLSRRLSVGDSLILFDGQGHEAAATIAVLGKTTVEVAIAAVNHRPRPHPALTLAVAMPKGPRQDVLIEKCTELGVAALQPLITERSVSGASDHKRDKWRRATVEAAKQSGQAWLPELFAPVSLDTYLQLALNYDLVIAAMAPRESPPEAIRGLSDRLAACSSVLALVGPEGGWSPQEAEALVSRGAAPVSLGPNVLRIETAAIALSAAIHALQARPVPITPVRSEA